MHGVITRALMEREVGHTGLTALEVVETMHERKVRMVDRADAVVMLPGGLGTLDEFFEAATWTQLGIHDHQEQVGHRTDGDQKNERRQAQVKTLGDAHAREKRDHGNGTPWGGTSTYVIGPTAAGTRVRGQSCVMARYDSVKSRKGG